MAKCVPVIAVGMPGAVNTLDNLALDGVETEGTALGIHVKTRVGVLHRGLGSPGNIDAIKGAVEVGENIVQPIILNGCKGKKRVREFPQGCKKGRERRIRIAGLP